ncbi:Predicted N-formylglutamate amidohydrolase [Arboricoccus pini]|uniref:Predicted N-formylglutamate amidohydrolase n=1 Tax=Arboricoccus pini TaxID=1963835 RepID=A0A212RX27_9PROT|nr:N-formylglutamate amidohydrolase [Arboricoccus pini]SNB77330.1 Predicted N-formylglutamate amidohydrolase [Arboricoccus pini]
MAEALLLAPDEPSPVRHLRPDGSSPFVFTCDHADRLIPRRLGRLGLEETEIARHIGWDIGIWEVGLILAARFDAPLIGQGYSRLVIDCNRPPEVQSSIPEISESTVIPGNLHLSDHDRQRRQNEIFEPYHAVIADALEARRLAGRRTILVALHSFTPVFKDVPRPWEIGLLFHRDRRLADRLLPWLRHRHDIKTPVGENEPYAVSDETDYTIPVHGEGRGLPHVAVEIRQDLLLEPVGQRRWAGLFGDALTEALALMPTDGPP